ncbi:juvenile hormone acid O-methyltransferase-like [Diorhabda sublineata]|uniref:juvenile hormone acid O-methyltransferase-like n=1 Tax=Diorhabda sublineata TaxID=1163346 RepID=UPI0024E0EA09|nr:juvenile hormone acid O-methyltransferase-like [Diorhabda sublineata]
MNVMVLPELFAKHVHVTSIHSVYLLNKYKHLIKWKNNPSIMEFGFGDGGTSAAALQPLIPQDCKEFIAADVSQQMVKYAKQNAKLPKVGKIIQFNISAQDIPLEFQNRFDHIFSFFTFHCIPKISASKAFNNVYKMLKPGGQTFHVFLLPTPLDDIFYEMSKHLKWGKYGQESMLSPYYFESNQQDSCKRDIVNSGFVDIEMRLEEFVHEFPHEEAWKENYIAVNAAYSSIPLEEKEEYKKYFFKRIKEKVIINNEDNDRFPRIRHSIFVVSAKK